MKTLIPFLTAAVLCGGQYCNPAQAFIDPSVDVLVRPGKLLKDQILTKDGKSKIDVQTQDKISNMRGGLKIRSFQAFRDEEAGTINFTGSVVFDTIFTKAKPVPFNFKIQRMQGTAWTTLAEGTNKVIEPNTPVKVLRTINGIGDAMRLRLAVWSETDKMTTRELTLPAAPVKPVFFVVTYSTNGWVPVRHYTEKPNPNKLIAEAATAHASKLRPLGFQTKIKIDKTEIPFFESNEIWLFAQALTPIPREFSTLQEAEAFRSELFSLMRNIDGRGPVLKVGIDQRK